MKKLLMIGGVLGFLLTAANAQPVTQNTLTGTECWQAGQGPGGPGSYICANLVRNSTANVALTIAASFTVGGNVTTATLSQGGAMLVTAQPLAATITLPANPVPDGAVVAYCNVTSGAFATNVVTFAANSNQTLSPAVTLTTQAATSCAKVQWNLTAATWYRVQ